MKYSRENKELRSFYRGHYEKWKASGLAQCVYCKQHNLIRNRFLYWKAKFIKDDSSVQFVQAPTPQKDIEKFIKITTPSGVKIQIPDNYFTTLMERALNALKVRL